MPSKGGISFQKIPCLKCGADRILGVACDDCGAPPPPGEVNAHVVSRRTAVRRIDELVAAHQPLEGPLPNRGELWRAVRAFSDAVARFAEDSSSRAGDRLAQTIAVAIDLHSRCESAGVFLDLERLDAPSPRARLRSGDLQQKRDLKR